jgi:hypothetical protein
VDVLSHVIGSWPYLFVMAWAMKRWAAVLGSRAVVCFRPACSSSGTSSGVAGSSPTSPASFAAQADHVLADLAAGNFTAVEAKFGPAMMKAGRTLPLPRAWAGYQQIPGRYRSHGAPVFARQGQFDTEFMPVTMAHRPGVVIIYFTRNGTIAAMYFRGPPP